MGAGPAERREDLVHIFLRNTSPSVPCVEDDRIVRFLGRHLNFAGRSGPSPRLARQQPRPERFKRYGDVKETHNGRS